MPSQSTFRLWTSKSKITNFIWLNNINSFITIGGTFHSVLQLFGQNLPRVLQLPRGYYNMIIWNSNFIVKITIT
ncbi:hypothetical protein ACFOUP_04480 [Belliella kenyensis]|uniref:Translation initiation factor beta propellor-like domain-containing protein n=1 Tax=Belliella kenyensis TaxID=1472724 RepID=A0ABV8EIJ4_9BACT